MNAGESTEAELSVIAPGADAVGYRLDICMREDDGPRPLRAWARRRAVTQHRTVSPRAAA